MVKQKKHTCITQSGKNYAINCAIQGVRLIWKQEIWLAICKFLWSLTNQNAWFVSSFCTEFPLFCTVFEKNCTALNQSEWRNFFMIIISQEKGSWFSLRSASNVTCWVNALITVDKVRVPTSHPTLTSGAAFMFILSWWIYAVIS